MRLKHLFALAGSLLLSHFIMLSILALILQFTLGRESVKHLVFLEWAAPVLVIIFGLYLVLRYRKRNQHAADCHCALHSKDTHQHHGSSGHEPERQVKDTGVRPDGKSRKLRHTALAGALAGLVPCPTAIAPIGLAGATNQFSDALLFILVYVLGMALTLTILAFVFLAAREKVMRLLDRVESRINVQLLSALLIVAVGVTYLGINLVGHAHHVH
jgi:ABC-type nickel/cobalt efflux system permease component RcnA